MTAENSKKLLQLCKEVSEYLRQNFNPHTRAIIDSERADIVADEFGCGYIMPGNREEGQ